MEKQRNYYEVLGVSRDATVTAIKKAYRQLAKSLHPDRNPGNDGAKAAFTLVQEAYEVLIDDLKRFAYDAKLHDDERPKRRPRPPRPPRRTLPIPDVPLEDWIDLAEKVTDVLSIFKRMTRR